MERDIDSLTELKLRLRNYKSHIKKRNTTWNFVKHFMDECTDPITPFNHLHFIIINVLVNRPSTVLGRTHDITNFFW